MLSWSLSPFTNCSSGEPRPGTAVALYEFVRSKVYSVGLKSTPMTLPLSAPSRTVIVAFLSWDFAMGQIPRRSRSMRTRRSTRRSTSSASRSTSADGSCEYSSARGCDGCTAEDDDADAALSAPRSACMCDDDGADSISRDMSGLGARAGARQARSSGRGRAVGIDGLSALAPPTALTGALARTKRSGTAPVDRR